MGNRSQARKRKWKPFLLQTLSVSLIIAFALQAAAPGLTARAEGDEGAMNVENVGAADYLDKIVFGQAESESSHRFRGDFTSVITGSMGEPARISNPRIPQEGQGGDLTFTMKVDPYLRNYLTVKFWGEESSSKSMIHINGEQVGYLSYGDSEAINKGWMLSNRFFYNTVMLPLESTAGKETVEITINTLNQSGDYTTDSRGFYNAYTHTQAYINVEGEAQGNKLKADQTPDTIAQSVPSEEEQLAIVHTYRQDQINKFNTLSANVDQSAASKLSIVRYVDELAFYASMLNYSWAPAQTPQQKTEALQRIFKSIDNHVKDYYGNTRLLLRGGHQGDWGGYYGALGEALYVAENVIMDDEVYGAAAFQAFLDEPFATGTTEGEFSLAGVDWNGGELTRREAWERVLKANFDFARTRLSYIYNQVYYTYVGAWEAHEGLRLIHSDFYEGRERSQLILLESLGLKPFLGEEVLVGPDGEELDLYHSLFYHDSQAVFTDDFTHIVGKGLAKSKLDAEGNVVRRMPYGEHYTGLTEGGLARENTFVAGYGEAPNYLVNYFYKTANHDGDELLNDELLKGALRSIHARGQVRYSALNVNGKRTMVTDQITDERGMNLSGFEAYGARLGSGMGLQFAALEMAMAKDEERYSSPEWDEYWEYARAAVGYVQQQYSDGYMSDLGNLGTMSGVNYYMTENHDYVTGGRADYDRFQGEAMAGVILPQTDLDFYSAEEMAALGVDPADYEQRAWVDVDGLYVSLRDEDVQLFGSLYSRNRGMAANGRVHVITDKYDHIVQLATNNLFRYEDYYLRVPNIDWDFQNDRPTTTNWSGAPQVLGGEPLPISYQPGVGTVDRDNFEADTPYSGYPELQTSRYGKYFMIFNTTRDVYGNERTFEVELPADFSGSEVLDLVTGTNVPVIDGKVVITPKSAMVLKLTSDVELAPKPYHVDFVHALAGNGHVGVSWKLASGGETYTIKRSETEEGEYETIASGITGNYYEDTDVQHGKVYYYKVAAVNEHGSGWDSWRIKVDVKAPVSVGADSEWLDERIGTTTGTSSIDGGSIAISGADGSGLGEGDDHLIYNRDIHDTMHYVRQVAAGNSSISARIDSASGEISGIMLRDRSTTDKARYIYFGADDAGRLVLQTRTRNSIVNWTGDTISPLNAKLQGYTVAEFPYVKLVRDHDTQFAYAFVSKDGEEWTYVTRMSTLLPYAYYAGVAASDTASFSEVEIVDMPPNGLTPFIDKKEDRVNLYWNKPKQASWFNLYRTTDEAASQTEPELKPGTPEPVEGSAWTLVLEGTRATSYKETNLRHGMVYYGVVPVHADGTPQPFYGVSIAADSLEVVLERAESYERDDYTRASYYRYERELDEIKEQLGKPETDEQLLIEQIYAARNLLVPIEQLFVRATVDADGPKLFGKVAVEPSMVVASHRIWSSSGGTGTVEQNGWFAFDGDIGTGTDTQNSRGWVVVDFGEGRSQSIQLIRYHPRTCCHARTNNGIIQGSNDGTNWDNLHTISGITEAKWHTVAASSSTAYRYFRYLDDHGGHTNIAELELYRQASDRTLLQYWLDEAEFAVQSGIYTEESYVLLDAAVEEAMIEANRANLTQEEADAAADALKSVLDDLSYIPGMPVLLPMQNQTIIAEQTLQINLETANATGQVEYSVTGLPAGASFDAESGQLTWTPGKEQGGVYEVTFAVTAGDLFSSRTMSITVKGQPTIGADETVERIAKQAYTYQVAASDPIGSTLTYSVANLPVGAVFNSASGLLTWMPGQADYGSHSVMFTVDNGSFSVSQTLTIEVKLNVLAAAGYTRGSYYVYFRETERIEAEMNKPGADKAQLASELAEAESHLVPGNVLGEKIAITAPMVTASHVSWNQQYTQAQNGWFAFDADLTTATDNRQNPGWIVVDLGEGQAADVDYVRFHPRTGTVSRVNGAIIQGSNDGENFADLYTISGITANEWHTAFITGDNAYRYWRYYSGNGFANVAELEFMRTGVDRSLLDVLLDEASALHPELYTEESIAVLESAIAAASSLLSSGEYTQSQVDAAATNLVSAIDGLELGEPPVEPSVLTALLSGPDEAIVNEALELSIGVTGDNIGFTIAEFVVHYDPTIIQFETVVDGDGYLVLTDEAIESSTSGLQVLVNGVKPEEGQIFIMLGASSADAVTEAGELITLHGSVRADAGAGSAVLSLSDFHTAFNSDSAEVDTTQASLTIQIKLADKNALADKIEEAEQLHLAAVVGGQPGQYSQSAKDALGAAIAAAKVVRQNEEAGQAEVEAAMTTLAQAIQTFQSAVNPSIPVDPANKTALNTAIAQAQNRHDQASEGVKVGQYVAGAKTALLTAIQAAKAVRDNAAATQSQADQATAELNSATQTFLNQLITLVPGQTKITIRDLSIIAQFYGTTAEDENWSDIEKADVIGDGEINIRVLAAIARMILDDWLAE